MIHYLDKITAEKFKLFFINAISNDEFHPNITNWYLGNYNVEFNGGIHSPYFLKGKPEHITWLLLLV